MFDIQSLLRNQANHGSGFLLCELTDWCPRVPFVKLLGTFAIIAEKRCRLQPFRSESTTRRATIEPSDLRCTYDGKDELDVQSGPELLQ